MLSWSLRDTQESIEGVLEKLRSLSTAGVSAETVLDAFEVFFAARGLLDSCEYSFHTHGGFSSDPEMRRFADAFEKARASISARLFDEDLQATIGLRLRADSAQWCSPHQDDDLMVCWCTLNTNRAGPLGTLLVVHLEHSQVPTQHSRTWARFACIPSSYVPSDLLLRTPLWLYRYVLALDPSLNPACSQAYRLDEPVLDYLAGLWSGSSSNFARALSAAHRLASRPPTPPLAL